MRRPLNPDDIKIWSMVAATVRARPGRTVPKIASEPTAAVPEPAAKLAKVGKAKAAKVPAPLTASPAPKPVLKPAPYHGPNSIEPRRKQRLARERDPITARLDLHGLGQDQARRVLEDFLMRAQADGLRAVLVITGKGFLGDGILRRRTPDWLSSPNLRSIVAGVSEAHRRHGGEGALYIALKKRPNP